MNVEWCNAFLRQQNIVDLLGVQSSCCTCRCAEILSLRSVTIINIINQPVDIVIQCWSLFKEYKFLLSCLCISITDASSIYLFFYEAFLLFVATMASILLVSPKYSSIQHAHVQAYQFRETEWCCLEMHIQDLQFISCRQSALILMESKCVHTVFTDISRVAFVFSLCIKSNGKIKNLLFIQPHWLIRGIWRFT